MFNGGQSPPYITTLDQHRIAIFIGQHWFTQPSGFARHAFINGGRSPPYSCGGFETLAENLACTMTQPLHFIHGVL